MSFQPEDCTLHLAAVCGEVVEQEFSETVIRIHAPFFASNAV